MIMLSMSMMTITMTTTKTMMMKSIAKLYLLYFRHELERNKPLVDKLLSDIRFVNQPKVTLTDKRNKKELNVTNILQISEVIARKATTSGKK